MEAPKKQTKIFVCFFIINPTIIPTKSPTINNIHKLASVLIKEGIKFKTIILIIKQKNIPDTKIAVNQIILWP